MPPNRRCRHGHDLGEDSEECSRSSCQEDKEHEAKPASAQTLLEVSSFSLASKAEALPQVSQLSVSGHCLSSPPVPRIWERLLRHWGRRFYIRLDRQGYLHTYPDVGGPFQTFEETDAAIDRHLEPHRHPMMCVKEDKHIRECIYWPDGRIKRCKTALATEKFEMRQFAQALVDKHNDENSLLEDRAHEVQNILHYKSICENLTLYYHLNFTTKIKGGGPNESSMGNLFFVEVERMKEGKFKEQVVRCFCTVTSSDDGRCHGCTKNGVIMKHPSNPDRYYGGHLNLGLPIGSFAKWKRDYEDLDDDAYVRAREAELREMFKVYYTTPPTMFISPPLPPPEARPRIHKFYGRKRDRDVLKKKKKKNPSVEEKKENESSEDILMWTQEVVHSNEKSPDSPVLCQRLRHQHLCIPALSSSLPRAHLPPSHGRKLRG